MEGRLLAGRYELLEPVGGSSWRATDTELGREVLVRLGDVPASAAALSHPNIERVFDQGEEDGERYTVLEHLPGGSLADRGELSAADAAAVAAALEYAHSQGVAHGALDADAILFDADGRAKLTGFRGAGDAAADLAALDALRREHAVTSIAPPPPPPEEPTMVIQRPTRRTLPRRNVVLLAFALLLVAAAGVGAALLSASDDSTTVRPTASLSVPVPTGTAEIDEPPPPPSSTTESATKPTTEETQPPTTETQPPTTPTEPPPPVPSEPLPTAEPTEPPLPTVPSPTIELPPIVPP